MDRTQADVTPNLDALVAAVQSSASCLVKHEQEEAILDPQGLMAPASDDDGQDLEMDRPLRRKRRVKGQKICGVCGDHAQSHNFGALTCETCKAFFRRNAFKQKELQTCVFNSSCSITKATRRFCAPCRLKKCYSIGMDPELILDSVEREERHKKRSQTTARKRMMREQTQTSAASTTTPDSSLPPPPAEEADAKPSSSTCETFALIEELPTSKQGLLKASKQGLLKASKQAPSEELKSEPAPDSNISSENPSPCRSSVSSEPRPSGVDASSNSESPSTSQPQHQSCSDQHLSALDVRFKHVQPGELSSNPALYWSLQPEETIILDNLARIQKELFLISTPGLERKPMPFSFKDLPVEKMMLAVDHLLRKFIKLSKGIPDFRQLPEADQIALLKSAAMRMYCVRLGEAFVPERVSWLSAVGEVSEYEVSHLFKEPRILRKIVDFCQRFKSVVKDDATLSALVYIQVLFDPCAPHLQNSASVNSHQDRFMVLLKHYLESRFSFVHASRYLAELMQIIVRVNDLGQNLTEFFSEEEKRARLTKRDREGPSPGPKWEKRHSQSSEPQSTNFKAPILSPNSTNSTASPGSSVDSGIDVGTTAGAANHSTSQLNYPDKGKWCRPKNALGKHFKHVAREDLPWDMQLFWPLQAEERSLLTKLTSAYQSVTTNTTLEDLEKMRQWGSFCMEKAIFALEYSMREYVEFARVIPEFKQLRQGDQIAVLKASALMWYHIRLASDFIPERRSWVNAFGAMSEVDLGNFLGDPHSVQEYAEFCEGLKFVVKNDTTLYALMHTLVLFDPRDNKVEDRIMVNTLKDKYLVLLKHHLESQFSYLHSDRYMAEIAQQILDLRQLGESSLIFYKHFQSQFRPLIAEVFAD